MRGDHMENNFLKEYMDTHPSFTTKEFAEVMRIKSPNIASSTIYYTLNQLCASGSITRSYKGHYIVTNKHNYYHPLSITATNVSSLIQKEFPLVDFQIWELTQMNEFVNHLIANNVIFIDVENMLDESVFNFLFENYPHVLFKPKIDEYYKYFRADMIIVQKLMSEVPCSYGPYKQSPLEKLLVDLFGRGLTQSIIYRQEYRTIFEDSFEKYNVNIAKMFRYAKRRGIDKKVLNFIQEETIINLEVLTND